MVKFETLQEKLLTIIENDQHKQVVGRILPGFNIDAITLFFVDEKHRGQPVIRLVR